MSNLIQKLLRMEKTYECIVHSRDGTIDGAAEKVKESELDAYIQYWNKWNYDVEIVGQGFGEGIYE